MQILIIRDYLELIKEVQTVGFSFENDLWFTLKKEKLTYKNTYYAYMQPIVTILSQYSRSF